MTGRRRPSLLVMLASIVGGMTILYPFLLPLMGQQDRLAQRGVEVPLLFAILSGICLLTILVQIQQSTSGPGASESKLVALLGVLVATDAALRLIPTVLGASPIFLLIILTGFAYGADFGFLNGRAHTPRIGLHHGRDRPVAPLSDAVRRVDRPDCRNPAAHRKQA